MTGCEGWTAEPTITWSSLSKWTNCEPAFGPCCGGTARANRGHSTWQTWCWTRPPTPSSETVKPIELTAKEFSLLEYLMRHPNHLITREMAEEHLWSYDHVIASNVVDVYIRRLRSKIDDQQRS